MTYPNPGTVIAYTRDGSGVHEFDCDHVQATESYLRVQPEVLDPQETDMGESRVPETRYIPWHRVYEVRRTGKGHE